MIDQTAAAQTSDVLTWLYWVLAAIGAVLLIVLIVIVRKGLLLPGDHVFRASRWSKGNRIFPSQVIITPASVTLYRPQFIGKLEESIHMAHVSSITIDTHVLFADVTIETSGGRDPVICYGHTKGDAVEIKNVIEKFQSDYYRRTEAPPPVPAKPS